MKRTRKKHNAVIKAKGWWWRRSGGPDDRRVGEGGRRSSERDLQLEEAAAGRGGERFRRQRWRARMLGRGVSKSVVLLTGDRGVESIALQQRGFVRTGD